ncbi:hypothetical protein F4802DRAFT_8949 [Xylaria palmicola]|nr:hypothetical protein F4802DRAFT_8949 [Xylaria palmicola]
MASTAEKQAEPRTDANANTMRAWTYTKAGSNLAAALTLSSSARRPPTPLPADRLLVRVTHMSPNPADHKIPEIGRAATLLMTRSLGAVTPGLDYAGVVEEVGRGLAGAGYYARGDAVFGCVGPTAFGTLAEYVQPTAAGCAVLPPSVSPADASTLGTAAQTAYQALRRGHVGPGDEVFVNGGSGGVGTFAVQIAARALGCVVTTTCSARNAELCRALGAATVLDYAATDVVAALRARGRVFRLVVDNVGDSPAGLYAAADDYLVPDGAFVQVGGQLSLAGARIALSRALLPGFLGGGRRAWTFMLAEARREDLEQLARWMQEGTIRAVVDGDVFPFEEAPKAYEKLNTGRTRGKLVVKVSD